MKDVSQSMRRTRLIVILREYQGALTLFGLGAFAVSQPVLSDLRAGAGYFVARRVEAVEIVLLVMAITLAPGVVANLIVWVAGRFSTRIAEQVRAGLTGVFIVLLVQSFVVRFADSPWFVTLIPAIAIGAATAVGFYRYGWLKDAFAWLIPVPLIVAAFFLLTPPVSRLILPPALAAIDAEVDRNAPVVFIVFDEFPLVSLMNRQGEIDDDRFPNFAALAETSTWHKYTASSHDNTLWAIPALLTGGVPYPDRLPTTTDYPGNLFTLLSESHDLHVVEPFTHLCPPEMCGEGQAPTTFGQRFGSLIGDSARLYVMSIAPDPSESASVSDPFSEFVGGAEQSISREASADQPARFNEFLNGITSAGAGLHFAHVFLPHVPYRYYPSGRQYLGGGRLDGLEDEIWVERALADQAYQRHLLQVQYVDDLVGQLLARLDEVGILDDAIVVVTADHGASFRVDSPRRAIEEENAYEIGMVPLFIKAPSQSSGVVDTNPARTIDVLPTVAQYLGVELPWLHEGQPLTGNLGRSAQLEVQAVGGGQVELDSFLEGVFDASEYAYSIFGDATGRIDPYSLGEYDSLINRTPGELSPGSARLDARVEGLWRLAHVDTTASYVPGFVEGELIGDVAPGTHVAVGLNGRIKSVVPVLDDDGAPHFSTVLPEQAFVPGFNELTLMAVSGPDQSPEAARIQLDGQHHFQLLIGDSGEPEHVIDKDGREWKVTDEPVLNGYVDATEWYPTDALNSRMRDLVVVGWAVDKVEIRPAERVAFFVDGVFAGSVEPDIERPDIERAYSDPDALRSGFRGQVSHFSPTENCELRAFALSGDNGFELDISERARSSFLGC